MPLACGEAERRGQARHHLSRACGTARSLWRALSLLVSYWGTMLLEFCEHSIYG